MKITKIITNERRTSPMNGETFADYCLYIFRTPVIITINGMDKVFTESAAILYSEERRQFFRGAGARELRYDLIRFKPSSGDRQYIGGLDIPLDTPIDIPDIYDIACAVRSMAQKRVRRKRQSEMSELHIRMILIYLEEACTSEEVETSNIPRYNQLKQIRRELFDDPVHVRTVDELCRRLAVSRTYFHRIYMEAFGVTFRQDAIESRLAYACELLRETELSISVIAEKCGYESDSYFMRQFRLHKGCTPSEYRKINFT